MKVKVFNIERVRLGFALSDWLAENPNITIIHMAQSQNISTVTLTILYTI